jgi:methylmalonyl-CoA epimerase
VFRRLDHVGIAVRDLDQAMEKMRTVLGLRTAIVAEDSEQGIKLALVPTRVGRFELMQPTSPDSVLSRFMERRGEGMHHVCFAVDDIMSARQRTKSRGGQLVQEQPRNGLTGVVDFIHPKSTGGVLVEIAQITRFTPAASQDLQFHHVTIRTHDKDAAAELWSRLFDVRVKRHAVSEGYAMATAWLDAGDAEIEFAQQLNETGPVARALKTMGEGLHAVVLESSRPDQVVERARSQGVRVIVDEGEPTNVLRAIHPLDFLGTLVLIANRDVAHGGRTRVAAGGDGH